MQKVIKDLLDNSGFEIEIISESLVPDCFAVGMCSTFAAGDCPVVKEYLENPDDYEVIDEDFTLESLELVLEDHECLSTCSCFDEDMCPGCSVCDFVEDDDDPCAGCEFEFDCGEDNPCPF